MQINIQAITKVLHHRYFFEFFGLPVLDLEHGFVRAGTNSFYFVCSISGLDLIVQRKLRTWPMISGDSFQYLLR